MEIVLNGERIDWAGTATVLGLLEGLRVSPAAVAVERNLEIVPRARFAAETLCDGDRIEIIRMVGGG